jgi:pre-mRNA 3'-end-processing factor FIP1
MENTPVAPAGPRGTGFRGRVQPVAPRARGAPAFRGRGRGSAFDAGTASLVNRFPLILTVTHPSAPPTGPRAASPLPPNVPTGPRNQHRYKDRDTGAPTSEPLDYGGDAAGNGKDRPLRDEFGRDIERGSKDDESSKSSRKRRGSPPDDSGRSKRR